jgi:hypothetical protein
MADGEDARVDAMQTPGSDTAPDHPMADPAREQLRHGHHSMLLRSELGGDSVGRGGDTVASSNTLGS